MAGELTFPTILVPSRSQWGSISPSNNFTSSTGLTQSVKRPGFRWITTLVFTNLDGDKLRELEAFVTELEGMSGRVYIPTFHRLVSDGSPGTSIPQVNGAQSSGSSMNTKGWDPSTLVLKRGNYFQVGDELFQVMDDVTSDGSGLANINIKPNIRMSHLDNDSITIISPKARMFLKTDTNKLDFTPPVIGAITLQFEENIRA